MRTEVGFDTGALGGYLEANVDGFRSLVSIEKFSDGQSNPTYLIDAVSGRYVLRKQPGGELLKSAHAVDREFRVMQALGDTEVPVPHCYHLCLDRDVIGSLFFVMSYEQGSIFWDPVLQGLCSDRRAAMYDEMNRVLAALHRVDPKSVGLGEFGRPGNYFERQISRWSRQYRASETETIIAMDSLIECLPRMVPADDGRVSLIHGDFRIDNLVFHVDQPKIRAVLDWELSTLGHPFADVAYQCMQWRMGRDDAIAGFGDADRESLGLPLESEYVDAYCRRLGIQSIDNWPFFLAFNFFRMAAILQGVLKRGIEGNASSEKAFEYGALTPKMAGMGAELLNAA